MNSRGFGFRESDMGFSKERTSVISFQDDEGVR